MKAVKDFEEKRSDYAKVKRAAKYGVINTPFSQKDNLACGLIYLR